MKRVFARISSKIKMRFYSCNLEYFGTVINLSENGMFISVKEVYFPIESQFEIFLLVKEEILKIPAEVIRVIKSSDLFDGIGVKLINPPLKYLEVIKSLKSNLIVPTPLKTENLYV